VARRSAGLTRSSRPGRYRLIQSEIQDRLAMALLSGGVRDGDLVRVDVAADGSVVLTSARSGRQAGMHGIRR
jgi:ATP-dependent Clp protease ATP-binding subunit ClpB